MQLSIELAIVCLLAAYFVQRHRYLRRRNFQTWESMSGQIPFDAITGSPTNPTDWSEFLAKGSEQLNEQPRDFHSLWTLFQNARILMEMIDYAGRNSTSASAAIDPTLLQSLRSDAMQIRVSALMSFPKYLLSRRPA